MTTTLPATLALFGLPGGMEMVVILIIGLLLFGARLPSVGRNIGKSITEFKKGLKEASDEMGNDASSQPGTQAPRQMTQDQMIENATQEALRRLKAEQAGQSGNSSRNV